MKVELSIHIFADLSYFHEKEINVSNLKKYTQNGMTVIVKCYNKNIKHGQKKFQQCNLVKSLLNVCNKF